MTQEQLWIKQLESIIEPALDVPMWKHLPQFPFEQVSLALSNALELENLSLRLTQGSWKPSHELLSGYGAKSIVTAIELSPLASPLFLVIGEDDIEKVCNWTLSNQKISNPDLSKTYFHYVLTKALQVIDRESVYKDLHPKLSEQKMREEEAYVLDHTLEYETQSISLRLICPKSFYQNFNTFLAKQPYSVLDNAYKSSVAMTLPLEVGHVALNLNEWKEVRTGDFILLDYCTYHPQEKKGTLSLCLHQNPLFQVKIKHDEIKILDYIFHGEGNYMDEEYEEPIENRLEEEYMPPEMDESYSEEEGYSEELAPEEEASEEITFDEEKQELVSPQDIPLTLRVEVGKFNMSLENLLQLKPGNTIPLAAHPDQGVQLTLQGNLVGQGELIQIGDAIGVRITQLKE